MHGGGYSNFLKKIGTEAASNCLARFIIVDADRIMRNASEIEHFKIYTSCVAYRINQVALQFS